MPAGGKPAPPAAPPLPACVRPAPGGGSTLAVRAKPGARCAGLCGVDAAGALEVAVDAPAREGEANDALTLLLADALGLKRRDLALTAGARGRDKVFAVELLPDALGERVRAALAAADVARG